MDRRIPSLPWTVEFHGIPRPAGPYLRPSAWARLHEQPRRPTAASGGLTGTSRVPPYQGRRRRFRPHGSPATGAAFPLIGGRFRVPCSPKRRARLFRAIGRYLATLRVAPGTSWRRRHGASGPAAEPAPMGCGPGRRADGARGPGKGTMHVRELFPQGYRLGRPAPDAGNRARSPVRRMAPWWPGLATPSCSAPWSAPAT